MESRKLSISFGLLALVALHAVLLRAPLPTSLPHVDTPPRSFSFDNIQDGIANPAPRVNVTARDEAKRQSPQEQPRPAQNQSANAEQLKTQSKPAVKKYNLDLFVASDPQSKSLLNLFNTDPNLKSLAAKCNYQVYAPGDELYKQRYSQWIPMSQFPAIVMTRPDGGHVYIASKAEIPPTSAAIRSSMYEAVEASVEAQKLSEQLAKQADSVESSPDGCIDGTCKKPPFFNRDRDRNNEPSLFPNRDPDPAELITSFLRSQGIGLESVALLVIALVIIVLILKR